MSVGTFSCSFVFFCPNKWEEVLRMEQNNARQVLVAD